MTSLLTKALSADTTEIKDTKELKLLDILLNELEKDIAEDL